MKAESLRLRLVFGVLLLCAGAMLARLCLLMRDHQATAVAKAERQQTRHIPLPGRPGGIFARSGMRYVPLAVSRQAPSCFADPALIPEQKLDDAAISVSEAIGRDAREVQLDILRRRDKRFVWLKRRISPDQADRIRQLKLRGVDIQREWIREYPNGTVAATVLGFRRVDGVAGGGVELAFDRYLAARDGRNVVLADAGRRAIWPLPEKSQPPKDGWDVFLTIDAVIQKYLQEALAETLDRFSPKWATGVVVEPQTGRVVAMCSLPSFDPNAYSQADPQSVANRAITVPFEPGSVFKPIIAAGAVDAGVVNYQEQIYCENGTYRAQKGGTITDHGKSYDDLSVADGVVFSSNICMAKIGERLGNEAIHTIVKRFGFGEPTGMDLPGQSRGIIRPLAKWDGYSLRRVPFGQEISATAIQLAMAFSSLANGGLLLRPRIVDLVADGDGNEVFRSSVDVVRRTVTPQAAAETLAVMEEVVSRGTGRRCRMRRWRSFGKTGTAQIAGEGGGYLDGAYVGSFIGGAPTSSPRLLCIVSVYWPDASKGHYGATVAAPYVRQVLEKSLTYLNVPGDRDGGRATATVAIAGG